MKSLSYAFRIETSTISKIVLETCKAIWTTLQDTAEYHIHTKVA